MIERLIPAGDGHVVRVRCSERSEGDFRCDYEGTATIEERAALQSRRQALMSGRWTWLRQVHGAGVVTVAEPGTCAGTAADAAVTAAPAAVLAVHTADCAPVVVVGDGAVGVAHAGWRGLAAGVIGEVVAAVRSLARDCAEPRLRAVLGPVIRPCDYEFDEARIVEVAGAVGCDVGGVTSWGSPALDLAAAVRGALSAAGVGRMADLGLNTAHEGCFSHRTRGDLARHATAARLEQA